MIFDIAKLLRLRINKHASPHTLTIGCHITPTMNTRLIKFNVFYYLVTLTFFYQGYSDPSSSLGFGFYILGFWIISGVVLAVLVIRKQITIKRNWDKVGLFLATPFIFLLTIGIRLSMTDQVVSEWYQYKNGHQYRIVTYAYRSSRATKRKEYYRSQEIVSEDNTSFNSVKWQKDSTWIYFSEKGDTIKIEKYLNDKKVE